MTRETGIWYAVSFDPKEIKSVDALQSSFDKAIRIDHFDEGVTDKEIIQQLVERHELTLDYLGDESPRLQEKLEGVDIFFKFAQIMKEENGQIWRLYRTKIKVKRKG